MAWPTWLSREFKSQANRMAKLGILSCSAPVGETVHLPARFTRVLQLAAC